MLSWEEVKSNFTNGTVCFDNLCDEELMRYFVILKMQIHIFDELDMGNDISKDAQFEDGTPIDDKEGTLIIIANTAKKAHEYFKVLQKIIDDHPKDKHYFEELFKNCLMDYASNNGIMWDGN